MTSLFALILHWIASHQAENAERDEQKAELEANGQTKTFPWGLTNEAYKATKS